MSPQTALLYGAILNKKRRFRSRENTQNLDLYLNLEVLKEDSTKQDFEEFKEKKPIKPYYWNSRKGRNQVSVTYSNHIILVFCI